jgi:hypothetical protein
MGADNLGPPIPKRVEVEHWLRENARQPPSSRIGRWLGLTTEFNYLVSDPVPYEMPFFIVHSVFSVFGERGLLPLPALPGGSWGLFVTNGRRMWLLRPHDYSLYHLFRAEGRPLHEADPVSMAQFICDVLFTSGGKRHVVVADAGAVRRYRGETSLDEYVVNDRELDRVSDEVAQPSIQNQADGGWRLTFASLLGWMHDLQDLGNEQIDISRDFRIVACRRTCLSKRVFRSVPSVDY